MEIKVCIGSACHLKGSYDVLEKLKLKIAELNTDKINLKASFCLGHCGGEVTVAVNDEIFEVSPLGVEEFFNSVVLPKVEK